MWKTHKHKSSKLRTIAYHLFELFPIVESGWSYGWIMNNWRIKKLIILYLRLRIGQAYQFINDVKLIGKLIKDENKTTSFKMISIMSLFIYFF